MSTVTNKVRIRGDSPLMKDFGASAENVIFEDEKNLVTKYQELADIIPEKTGFKLKAETWNIPNMTGKAIWHSLDNNHIYYSEGTRQYELDKDTNTWISKTWSGLTDFDGWNVWFDENTGITYYSEGLDKQYYLDENSIWQVKTWNNNVPVINSLKGEYVWKNYDLVPLFSTGEKHYYLSGSGDTWIEQEFSINFFGYNVFYYNKNNSLKEVDMCDTNNSLCFLANNGWNVRESDIKFNGKDIWEYNSSLYLSDLNNQYYFDWENTTLILVEWDGPAPISGEYVWYDYDDIPHYSNSEDSNIKNGLIKEEPIKYIGTAAAKDIADDGDAKNNQIVLGNDSRLWELRIESEPPEELDENVLYFDMGG